MFIEELLDVRHWEKAFNRVELKFGDTHPKFVAEVREIIDSGNYVGYAHALNNGSFEWSIPQKVSIAKSGTSKKRIVYMYKPFERFLQGVLYRALSSYYKDRFAPNCFSYRQGVNTLSAITYIKENKQNKEMFGLKMDISAYFNSVAQEQLYRCIDEICPLDNPSLQGLRMTLEKILKDDTISINGFECEEYKSLVAGSPLGSFFANYCLRELDFYFAERVDEVVYARYSDDIIIMCETQEEIEKYRSIIVKRLEMYGLKINPKKYENFADNEPVEYLGLELSKEGVDISKHGIKKVKRTIKRWVKKERQKISYGESTFEKSARKIVKRLNHKYFKSFIIDPTKYGWGYYAFRFITTTKSLTELDFYLRDQLRYLKTGKHNKANIAKVTDDDFRDLGVQSLVDMYKLFRMDLDYYIEVCNRL